MAKIKTYKNKEDILKFLDDTDLNVSHAIEQRILSSYGYAVDLSLDEKEFVELLLQRELAMNLLDEYLC